MIMTNPLSLKSYIALGVYILLHSQLAAATQSYFTGYDFGMCVVKLIREKMPTDQIVSRLQQADQLRVNNGKELLEMIGGSFYLGPGQRIIRAMTPFSQQDAAEVMAFHSIPLINYAQFDQGQGGLRNSLVDYEHNQAQGWMTKGYLERLGALYRDYHDRDDVDFTIMAGFKEFLDGKKPPHIYALQFKPSTLMSFTEATSVGQSVADMLVDELLRNQNKMSIQHWDLLKKTTALYGNDVFTALGIIGTTFDLERVADGSKPKLEHRNKQLYLGSRMIPIFQDSENPMGDNYHFWLYMNASIQGKGSPAKIMAFTYQTLKRDFDELRADRVGLEAGKVIRDHLFDPNVSNIPCRLDH
jgi:hypothetical protein